MLAGLSLGILSSFHCVGMCGPLVLALPVGHLPRPWKIVAPLMYHAGRIGLYAALGLLFGLMGRRIYMAGFQQFLSIGLGIMILFGVIRDRWGRNRNGSMIAGKFLPDLRQWTLKLWKSPSKSKFIWLGMANALLPCGMVYLAIAVALSSGRTADAVVFMASFGAGTLPLLLGISYSGNFISLSFRVEIKKKIPLLIALTAILLILRGLNLGIPFISPVLAGSPGHAVSCH